MAHRLQRRVRRVVTGPALLDAAPDPNGRAADPNAPDQAGQTPPHWLVLGAVSAHDDRVALWLVRHGACPHLATETGAHPSSFRRLIGAGGLARLLEAAAPRQRGMIRPGWLVVPAGASFRVHWRRQIPVSKCSSVLREGV